LITTAEGFIRASSVFAHQALRLGRQRRRHQQIVHPGHHLAALGDCEALLHDGVFFRQLGPPPDDMNFHAQGMGADRGGPADFAVTDHAERLARHHLDIELLPPPGRLIVHHPPQVLGEVQNARHGEFAEGFLEDAAAVRHRHGTIGQRREQDALQPGRKRMDPLHARRHIPHLFEREAGPHAV
jgi:hypothetical protein